MAAFKNKKNGTWYVQFRYTNWKGERQQKLKRGFATKREALEWEREFLMEKQADVNMTFESFVDYYLKTDEILNYFRSNATGTAGNMPKINQKVVSETPLILPETQEQAEIVRLLDDLLAREQQAKEAAEGVLEQIDLIKKAILARAFRGELGTNDPCEESAVELLSFKI